MNNKYPLSTKNTTLYLPIKNFAVFVDWHGVLSDNFFWDSILKNTKHPFHQSLQVACNHLFSNEEIMKNWMTGRLSSIEIVKMLNLPVRSNFKQDYWLRKLFVDCRKMSVKIKLIEELKQFSDHSWLIIATDNMDCFYEHTIDYLPSLKIFDAVLSSNNIGYLKKESPKNFFGLWLEKHSVPIQNSLLIDDSIANCKKFKSLGGDVIIAKDTNQVISNLQKWKSKILS